MFDGDPSGFLLRALIATLEGLSPEQFAELEVARTQPVVDAEAARPAIRSNPEQLDCGLGCDETGRIIRRW